MIGSLAYFFSPDTSLTDDRDGEGHTAKVHPASTAHQVPVYNRPGLLRESGTIRHNKEVEGIRGEAACKFADVEEGCFESIQGFRDRRSLNARALCNGERLFREDCNSHVCRGILERVRCEPGKSLKGSGDREAACCPDKPPTVHVQPLLRYSTTGQGSGVGNQTSAIKSSCRLRSVICNLQSVTCLLSSLISPSPWYSLLFPVYSLLFTPDTLYPRCNPSSRFNSSLNSPTVSSAIFFSPESLTTGRSTPQRRMGRRT